MLDDIWRWLQDQFNLLLQSLDPVYLINQAAVNLAPLLPPSNSSIIGVLEALPTVLSYFLAYISWLDYFIDLRFSIACLVFMLAVESGLLGLRAWRVIRSLIT